MSWAVSAAPLGPFHLAGQSLGWLGCWTLCPSCAPQAGVRVGPPQLWLPFHLLSLNLQPRQFQMGVVERDLEGADRGTWGPFQLQRPCVGGSCPDIVPKKNRAQAWPHSLVSY